MKTTEIKIKIKMLRTMVENVGRRVEGSSDAVTCEGGRDRVMFLGN